MPPFPTKDAAFTLRENFSSKAGVDREEHSRVMVTETSQFVVSKWRFLWQVAKEETRKILKYQRL